MNRTSEEQKLNGAFSLVLILGMLFCVSAFGEDRSRSLDFEDELIEGMNKKPLDSLSHLNQKDKKRAKTHLYTKRAHFNVEEKETLNELRFIQ